MCPILNNFPFFSLHTQQEICSNGIIKEPTTPRRVATLPCETAQTKQKKNKSVRTEENMTDRFKGVGTRLEAESFSGRRPLL